MSRAIFYPTRDALVSDPWGNPVAGQRVRVWTAPTGGTQITDLLTVNPATGATGSAVPSGILISDGNGFLPAFASVDGGRDVVYADCGPYGSRTALVADASSAGGGAVLSVDGLTGAVSLNSLYGPNGTAGNVAKALVDVNAADPQFGSTRDHVQINAAVAAVVAAGGGTVRVLRKDGPWTIGRRVSGQQKEGGVLIEDPNVTLFSDGAVLNLADNCDFIRVRSVLGTQVAITADTTITDTNLTVTSSTSFTVGQWVFVRLGQAAYDAGEPDFWLFAKVLSLPDATHVTLDRPTGYAMSVSATPTVAQRSIAPVTKLAENVAIEGTWNLINPMTGSANAEAGVSIQTALNCRVENLVTTDTGSGGLVAQFVEGLTVRSLRVRSAVAQGGSSSKGRAIGIAGCRAVSVGLVDAEGFERQPVFVEAHANAVTIDRLVLRNTFSGRDNTASGLIVTLGNASVRVDSLDVSGAGSYVHDIGTSAGDCTIREATFRTSTRPVFSNLGIVSSSFTIDGTRMSARNGWAQVVPLSASMSNVDFPLPTGYLRQTRIFASTVTGLTLVKFKSTGNISTDIISSLTAGATTTNGQGQGFGAGYNASSDTGKSLRVSTDTTVPTGSYLLVEVDAFVPDASPTVSALTGTVAGLPAKFGAQILPFTGVAATDIAALQAAHDALPSTGGIIRLGAGPYDWTSGFTFTKPVHLVGSAMDDERLDVSSTGASQVLSTSATATVLTLGAHGCHIEGVSFKNTAGSTPTAGQAILVSVGNRTKIHNCTFDGFFNDVYFNDGSFWEFSHNQVYNAVSYGLRCAHTDLVDGGDFTVHDNVFITGPRTSGTSEAIHWSSGGGGKFHGNKTVNGAGGLKFKYGLSVLCASISTSVTLVTGNSFEGWSSAGVIVQTTGSGQLGMTNIVGNEIAGQPTPGECIHLENASSSGIGLYNIHVSGNTLYGGSQVIGIYAKNTDRLSIGQNQIDFCGLQGIYLDGTCLNTTVAVQGYSNCPTPIKDNNPVSDSSSSDVGVIEHQYRRSIGAITSTSTYTNLYNVDLPLYSGATIEIILSGILQGVGPFFLNAKRVITIGNTGTLVANVVATDVAQGAVVDIQFSLSAATVTIGVRRNSGAGGSTLNGVITMVCRGAVAKIARL